MVIKKIKSTSSASKGIDQETTTVYRYEAFETGKKKGLFKRLFVILILMALNVATWSYLAYQIHVWHEEHEYTRRAVQQAERARLRERNRAAEAIALDTVALVGGKPITLTQVREAAETMDPLKEMPFEEVYPNLLRDMIDAQVLLDNATKAGVLDRPKVQQIRDSVVQQIYLDEQLAAHVTEDEVRQVYEEEIKNFKREEEIRARHILVKTEKEAKDIITQLNAGADFAELARKKSLGEKAEEGGDLGYFTKPMMIPEFSNAVFDMKKGQLSAPIKTVFGWHVVLVEDKRLADPPSLEDLHDEIFSAVMDTKLPMVLEEERAKSNVQILKPTWKPVE